MKLKSAIMQLGQHTVVTLKGPINHQNCRELEVLLQAEIMKNPFAVILECREVGYLDSAALETLLLLQNAIRERGSLLKLVGLNALGRDILTATRLINDFDVYSNLQEAIKEPL